MGDSGSLLHKIFKHNYFLQASLLDALESNNVSYTWHSLLLTKPLLQVRLRWSIGDDKSISVAIVPWILRPSTLKLVFPPHILQPEATVDVLITLTLCGMLSVLKNEFEPVDAEWILRTKMQGGQSDHWCWNYDKKGCFSVKSAYWLAMQQLVHRGRAA